MSKRKELGISTVGPSRPWSASGGHTTRLLRKPCSYAFSKYRFRPGWGGTCRETHERGTQRKRPEKDRQPARRRAALLTVRALRGAGLRRAVRPSAVRNIKLFPSAWGEKNSVTSSSRKVSPVAPKRSA